MNFGFATASQIIFGAGTIKKAGAIAAEMGTRAILLAGSNAERVSPLLKDLQNHGLKITIFRITGEPTIKLAMSGVNYARDFQADIVIGMGGGSVIDTGKVIAAMLTNTGDLLDYLEIIGKGKQISKIPAPYIAVPSTAGTGAEVTKNAVLTSIEHKVKVSMRSPLMFPKIALIDPELTYSMPKNITVATGMDALTHLMEAYVSSQSNPLTDTLCCDGLERASRSLWLAYEIGNDVEARENMCMASLFGGLVLANAGLGAVHGLAGPLGGMYKIPHGIVCARLLPYVMEANINALKTRFSNSLALERYDNVARILTGKANALSPEGIAWIKNLYDALHIMPLSSFGIKKPDFAAIAQKAKNASSMKGNPIALTSKELINILEKAF